MSTELIDRYRRWFEYEKDAHRKTLDSLRALSPEQLNSPGGQKAARLFAHLFAARQVWRFRLGEPVDEPIDYFPAGLSLDELEQRMQVEQSAWTDYLVRLDDAGLARVYEYRRSDGQEFRNSVEDTLTQMFGHSLYHRGQIAALVRTLGGQPAATDFIFWAREKLDVDYH